MFTVTGTERIKMGMGTKRKKEKKKLCIPYTRNIRQKKSFKRIKRK